MTTSRETKRSRSSVTETLIQARDTFSGLRHLALFAGVTLRHGLPLSIRATLTQPPLQEHAQVGQNWVKEIARALNLRVIRSGVLPPPGSLLVSNHRSYIDIAAILHETPCSLLAKSEVSGWPLVGWAARLGNTVFVERDNAESRSRSRERLVSLLKSGLTVAAFPEGTTSRGPDMRPMRPGLFRSAASRNLRVVPVALAYDDPADAWVGDDTFIGHFVRRFRGEPKTVRIHFGEPIRDLSPTRLQTRVEQEIRKSLVFLETTARSDAPGRSSTPMAPDPGAFPPPPPKEKTWFDDTPRTGSSTSIAPA